MSQVIEAEALDRGTLEREIESFLAISSKPVFVSTCQLAARFCADIAEVTTVVKDMHTSGKLIFIEQFGYSDLCYVPAT